MSQANKMHVQVAAPSSCTELRETLAYDNRQYRGDAKAAGARTAKFQKCVKSKNLFIHCIHRVTEAKDERF